MKKRKSQKEKELFGWGTFPSLLDSNLEKGIKLDGSGTWACSQKIWIQMTCWRSISRLPNAEATFDKGQEERRPPTGLSKLVLEAGVGPRSGWRRLEGTWKFRMVLSQFIPQRLL